MGVANLHFTEVGPFEDVSFEFDQHVNVFTGPNNSGKSTVLWVLGEILVFPFTLPQRLLRSDDPEWDIRYWTSDEDLQQCKGNLPSSPIDNRNLMDAMGYTCFIPAQRQGTGFRSAGPSVGLDIESRVDEELDHLLRERPILASMLGAEEVRRRIRVGRDELHPSLLKRGESLISSTLSVADRPVLQKIVDLDYASYRTNNPRIREVIQEVFSLASEITQGFPIEFKEIVQDEIDGRLYVSVATPYGIIPIDFLSQGTQSLVQCLARFFLGHAEFYGFSPGLEEKPGVLIIDEIDAHLHPTWQRRIIPTLARHFPNVQIFCSTHSPLLLAGLREGQVQLLRFDSTGRVKVSTNEEDIVGWSADEILRDFLQVRNPTDWETVLSLDRLEVLRSKITLTSAESEELENLRHTISRTLLSGPISGLLEQFADEIQQGRTEE